jgi:eukaryotic-like serine/threonine-protein kinase
MDNELAKNVPKIQADNQSIAIGEINISGTVTGNITIGHTIVQPAPTDARLRHDLGILLKNVQTTWIKGVLEKSVHEAALLELGLELREDAVDNPWRMVIEGPDQPRETLPRGRRIKDIFDEANRLLLILGEPGSGKTTTLLQLARDLIAEVDSAFTQPVPVILNLSTWTNKQQPLDEWLVAELNSKYRLPKKDGQRWLRERRILPLLDGLDEVRAENRAACVEKLNQLVTDYGLRGMVVCSRIKDYTDLNVRLAFYRAIYIQPLSPEQVDEYLERAGDKLASLRATLQADLALRNMAQSPLILNVMSLAYQNTSAEDLSDSSLNTDKARRKHLFNTYVARMFKRKSSVQYYDDEQTKQRLSWLARNMQRHNQEIFLIESLQPSWLSERNWQPVYILASRLSAALVFCVLVGLWSWLTNGLYQMLVITVPVAITVGLIISIFDGVWFKRLGQRAGNSKVPSLWREAINFLVIWLVVTLSVSLVSGLLFWFIIFRSGQNDGLAQGIEVGPFVGVIVGPIAALTFGLRGNQHSLEKDIQTVEALAWSWRNAARGGIIGWIVACIFLLVLGASFGMFTGGGFITFAAFLVFALLGVPLGVILNGLRRKIIETKSNPNQGIWLSIRNAIFGGLIVGLSFGLGIGILTGLINGLSYGVNSLYSVGVSFGLVGALRYGGLDVIQHYTLRLILLIQGQTPANYARFLDYAVDRIFLQKVGGGYRFIHRLLLEHFAEMGEAEKV